jgi:cathepsin L
MKKILALVALFLSVSSAIDYEGAFTSWMRKYGKSYDHDQFQYRLSIFKKNMDFIANYKGTARLAMNQFGDLTAAEFAAFTHRGLTSPREARRYADLIPSALPASWDWTTKGAVTPVKNQGQCGSCWAMSAVEAVEGCHFITTGVLAALSTQEVMDCDNSTDQGCNGGWPDNAFKFIKESGGVDTEACYPYTAEDGSCHFIPNPPCCGSTLTNYFDVQAGSESSLQQAVYQVPTVVAFDASQSSFQFYSSGVYYDPACSSTQIDHTGLAVGWGHDQTSGMDFWIVKNTWGSDWGMQGYIWMSRNKNNNCGIATSASYVTGCPGLGL